MNCRATRKRLVAFQDGELSPGERSQVSKHLAGCATCRHLERRLGAATPEPFLWVPEEHQVALEAALDASALAAHDGEPRTLQWSWLSRRTHLPAGAVLAYGALLVLALMWGVGNWLEARSLQVALQELHVGAPVGTELGVAPLEIPADQFRPASWTPESDVVDDSRDVPHPTPDRSAPDRP